MIGQQLIKQSSEFEMQLAFGQLRRLGKQDRRKRLDVSGSFVGCRKRGGSPNHASSMHVLRQVAAIVAKCIEPWSFRAARADAANSVLCQLTPCNWRQQYQSMSERSGGSLSSGHWTTSKQPCFLAVFPKWLGE